MQSRNFFGVVIAVASSVFQLGSVDTARAQVIGPGAFSGTGAHAPIRPVRRPPRSSTIFPELMLRVGPSPEAAGVGDFDGNGYLDLAVPNSFDSTVSIVLGDGGGAFHVSGIVSTGGAARHVAVGHFDTDGELDLAVACGSDGLYIHRGVGDGTFVLENTYVTGGGPAWVSSDDLDGDGDLDLAVANYGGNTIAILLGNGDASFAAPVTYTAGAGPGSIAIGKLNGDSVPDLVVGNNEGSRVSVLLGNGNGTFGAQQLFDCGNTPRGVALGDLNGDGKLDIAVGNATEGTVSVLLGNGNGTFGADVSYATGGTTQHVSMADLDGDLDLDLAVANLGTTGESSLLVLRNQGNGVMQAPQVFGAGGSGSGTAVADFDLDGRLDVAVTGYNFSFYDPGYLTIVRGKFGGTLEGYEVSPVAGTGGALVDLDADGDLDLATVFAAPSFVRIALGDGTGKFANLASYPVGARPVQVVTGYIDADAYLDLVVTNENASGPSTDPGTVTVLLGQGNGTFAAPTSVAVSAEPSTSALGHVDNDGNADLAVLAGGGSLHVFLGNGDGTFTAVPGVPQHFVTSPLLVRLADLNGDTIADALGVGGHPLQTTVRVRLGNGDGTFGAVQGFGSILQSGVSADVDDINGDGALDVAIGGSNGIIDVVLGNGDGTFGSNLTYSIGPLQLDVMGIEIGDVDLDGRADLALRSGGWTILRGRGDGTFHPLRQYYSGPTHYCAGHLGDVDLDGDLDLVGGTTASAYASLNHTNP
ncbi:MAG: FG-GAP repeat domain-containing protein [Planctomycetota bacterium]